jgi:superfamily I DNA/RNA helicase/mRNA-degrading endonuclease RelE of RelBE toxin-antitoxin system
MTNQKRPWELFIKPALLLDINRLPPKDVHQIIDKINLLAQDPAPDGSSAKKQLKYCPGKPYRLRSGDYRIFYTYNDQYIRIYKIDRRDQSTYTDCPEAEDVPEGDMADLDVADAGLPTRIPPKFVWEQPAIETSQVEVEEEKKSQPLPELISVELLNKLDVPQKYHEALLQIQNEDDLLTCQGVDQEILLTLLNRFFPTPMSAVISQPDLVLNDPDDLERYYEDPDLVSFLLKLSPEQEKYVDWPLNTSGPILIKGGPGTGKSTIALYRVRSLLQRLLEEGVNAPHILFTTYTYALIKSSKQLLEKLLGPKNMQYVDVLTADNVAEDMLSSYGQIKEILEDDEQNMLLRQAVGDISREGNPLQQDAQRLTLQRMGLSYLFQELTSVIVARQLQSVDEYLVTNRTGRRLSLTVSQRKVVWRVYEHWQTLVQATGKETWQQRRARAEELVEYTPLLGQFDAVIIDEAQDLDPSAFRMLVKLSKSSQRILVTADANQSIHSSGFTWKQVHQSLKFQGHTSVLEGNYRSTRQIGEAAQSYLSEGVLELEKVEHEYVNDGPKPDVRAVQNINYETQLLEHFFRDAMREQRLTLGFCAILCPNGSSGRRVARALKMAGLEAAYMTGQNLDLTYSGVKVLTLPVSKGLEFPIVALAGFVTSKYPDIPKEASEDEFNEILLKERRTVFVGMTRAMLALLVVVPAEQENLLLQGFDPVYWSLDRGI